MLINKQKNHNKWEYIEPENENNLLIMLKNSRLGQ